jgi:hypothetical protein
VGLCARESYAETMCCWQLGEDKWKAKLTLQGVSIRLQLSSPTNVIDCHFNLLVVLWPATACYGPLRCDLGCCAMESIGIT